MTASAATVPSSSSTRPWLTTAGSTPGFGPDFPAAMAQIVARADVAAPNLTEACLLTGTEYREDYDEDYIRALLLRLTELGAKQAVLTGVSFDPSQAGVMGYDGARFFSYFNRRDPAVYHGTGDLLASATVGGLMRGLPLEQALQLAVDFTLRAIELTRSDSQADVVRRGIRARHPMAHPPAGGAGKVTACS